MLCNRPHTATLFALVSVMLLLQGCEALNGPDNTDSANTIKSESKRLVLEDNSVMNQLVNYKEFSRRGNLISLITYYETGELLSSSDFTYISNESQEEKVVFGKDGIIISTELSSYIFDSNGNISEKKICAVDGSTCSRVTYAYDNKGNLTKKVEISDSDSSLKETEFQYNYADNGLVSERIVNPAEDGSYLARDSIIYDQNNSQINRFTFNSDGVIDYIQTYDYNDLGKITFEYIRNSEGEILKQYKFEYEYYN